MPAQIPDSHGLFPLRKKREAVWPPHGASEAFSLVSHSEGARLRGGVAIHGGSRCDRECVALTSALARTTTAAATCDKCSRRDQQHEESKLGTFATSRQREDEFQ